MASFASSITAMPGAKSPFEDAGAAVDQRRCRESKHCPCCCIVCRAPADGCRIDKCRQLCSVTENAEHSVTMPAAERRKIFILKYSICGRRRYSGSVLVGKCILNQQRRRSSHSNWWIDWAIDVFLIHKLSSSNSLSLLLSLFCKRLRLGLWISDYLDRFLIVNLIQTRSLEMISEIKELPNHNNDRSIEKWVTKMNVRRRDAEDRHRWLSRACDASGMNFFLLKNASLCRRRTDREEMYHRAETVKQRISKFTILLTN